MLEPHRSRYLRALGVDVYVPRQLLPGAAIAEPVAWELEVEAVVLSPLKDSLVDAPASGVVVTPSARLSLPDLEIAAKSVAKSLPQTPVIETSKIDLPRFSLMVARCDIGIVVIDEGPRAEQRREEYIRLLGSLMFALYRRPVMIEADQFVWPMVKNPVVDQGEQAARDTLGAYLQRQCSLVNGRTIVALGGGAAQWLNSDPDFHVVPGVSLWRCLADGSVKRTLWQQLQSLRTPNN